jgi:hypothetical protein
VVQLQRLGAVHPDVPPPALAGPARTGLEEPMEHGKVNSPLDLNSKSRLFPVKILELISNTQNKTVVGKIENKHMVRVDIRIMDVLVFYVELITVVIFEKEIDLIIEHISDPAQGFDGKVLSRIDGTINGLPPSPLGSPQPSPGHLLVPLPSPPVLLGH